MLSLADKSTFRRPDPTGHLARALAPDADLTVAALSAPPTAAAGAVISVTDRTVNLAVATAAPSTTRFFLSADATAGAGAMAIGARGVPALPPSATSAGVTSATIPPGTAAGTYYLVARADADGTIDERSEINNTRGLPIAIGPDLVVSVLSAPAEGAPGLAITVNETTLNRGAAAAGGSTTRFHLAAAPTASPGGVLLGARGVGPLGPGESSETVATLTIPAATAAGSYYVVARADADGVVGEFDEANNARSVAIRIARADLTVSALTVPTAAGPGGSISVSDTTRNSAGVGPAGPSTTGFYLSQNTARDASDVLLGSRAVPSLAAGASSTATTALVIPAGTATGRYYVVVQADSVAQVAETSETNNTRADPIIVSPPDLSVVDLSAPGRGGAGLPVAVTDTTRNMTGVGPAAASVTRLFLSKGAVVGPGDTSLGERAVPTLPPGSQSGGITTVTIPSDTAPGAYYIVAKADGPATLAETNEANNVRSVRISIGPDLVVTALSAPATGGAGVPLAVTDTVTNQGSGSAAVSTLRFYLSANGSYGAGDVLLGSRGVPSLTPAAASSGSTTLTIPSGTAAGTYYIVALVGGVAESDDTNNARSVAVKMSPDLVVSALTAPATARAGATISVTDTTKNEGQGVAASTTTRVYLSANTSVDSSDASLGSRVVPALAVAQASTATSSITIPAGTPPGSYYLVVRADADGVVAEAGEGNNTRSRAIAIAP
jgi:subtilase family serine protease